MEVRQRSELTDGGAHLVLEEGDAGHDGVEVCGEEGEVEPRRRGKPDHDVEAADAHELRHAEGQQQHRHLPQVPPQLQQLAALQDGSEVKEDTDMQENMWARLRGSCPGACLIHAT